jgi:hypothetical protein
MNFLCEELSITDDPDFGCQISFSDTRDEGDNENLTVEEIINSKEKYFLLQRSYSEGPYENDHYYIETTESDVELGIRDKVVIEMSMDRIKINWSHAEIILGLKLTEKEYTNLDRTLRKRFKDKLIMLGK